MPFERNTNGNPQRNKSPLPNSRKPAAAQKPPYVGYSPTFNLSPVKSASRPASSLLFGRGGSPFYEKKMNDLNSVKYKNKLKKQQQSWSYANRKGQFPIGRPFNAFANGRLTIGPSFKSIFDVLD